MSIKITAPYVIFLAVLGMLASMVISVTISIKASDRAVRDSQREVCGYIRAQDDAYSQVPPSTPTGANLARTAKVAREACDRREGTS